MREKMSEDYEVCPECGFVPDTVEEALEIERGRCYWCTHCSECEGQRIDIGGMDLCDDCKACPPLPPPPPSRAHTRAPLPTPQPPYNALAMNLTITTLRRVIGRLHGPARSHVRTRIMRARTRQISESCRKLPTGGFSVASRKSARSGRARFAPTHTRARLKGDARKGEPEHGAPQYQGPHTRPYNARNRAPKRDQPQPPTLHTTRPHNASESPQCASHKSYAPNAMSQPSASK